MHQSDPGDKQQANERDIERAQELLRINAALEVEIAQRKRVEEALRLSLERFDLMVAGSRVGLWDAIVNSDDPFHPDNPIYYSPQVKQALGFDESDEFGSTLRSWSARVHPDDAARVFQCLSEHLNDRVPYSIEYRMITKSGEVRWFAACGQAIWDEQGRPVRISGSLQDVTPQKLAEERLRQEQQFLKGLLKAHERDRQLTAYDVHDGLVQDTIGAKMLMESCIVDQQLADPRLDKLIETLGRAIGAGRRLISGLRPPILDELGIVSAIEYLIAERFSQPPPLVEFSCHVKFRRLDSLLESTLYRVVQESLANVQRHSQAERAAITLVQIGDRVQLTIRDWGCGFHPEEVQGERFGLQAIRKRVALLGGQAEITSAPGQGTCVSVTLSISPMTIDDSAQRLG